MATGSTESVPEWLFRCCTMPPNITLELHSSFTSFLTMHCSRESTFVLFPICQGRCDVGFVCPNNECKRWGKGLLQDRLVYVQELMCVRCIYKIIGREYHRLSSMMKLKPWEVTPPDRWYSRPMHQNLLCRTESKEKWTKRVYWAKDMWRVIAWRPMRTSQQEGRA